MNMNRVLRCGPWLAGSLALLLSFGVPVAAAEIDFTVDDVIEIAPPPSVEAGALEDSGTAFVFLEQEAVLLSSDLFVDAINPGAEVGGSTNTAVAGSIPAGTPVDSFLVHFDPVGEPTDLNVTVAWSVVFRSTDRILGLIYSDALLDASDFLGAPGTIYPTGEAFRGTTGNLEGNDGFIWSQFFVVGGLQSVTVSVDHFRIIVAVPEPTGLAIAASALLACMARRRRR